MATSRMMIKEWLESGIKEKATHMIVVCDTFDYDDYPVYVSADEDVREVSNRFTHENMQQVMEVYNLSMDIEKQLKEQRTFNY